MWFFCHNLHALPLEMLMPVLHFIKMKICVINTLKKWLSQWKIWNKLKYAAWNDSIIYLFIFIWQLQKLYCLYQNHVIFYLHLIYFFLGVSRDTIMLGRVTKKSKKDKWTIRKFSHISEKQSLTYNIMHVGT